MRNVALPELPGETLHVTDHGVFELETRIPAQRPVSEHPELAILGHGDSAGGSGLRKLYDVRRVSATEEV